MLACTHTQAHTHTRTHAQAHTHTNTHTHTHTHQTESFKGASTHFIVELDEIPPFLRAEVEGWARAQQSGGCRGLTVGLGYRQGG